jgi:hypothetical protein
MQLSNTILLDAAIFIEKKTVANRLWRKLEFWWRKQYVSLESTDGAVVRSGPIMGLLLYSASDRLPIQRPAADAMTRM